MFPWLTSFYNNHIKWRLFPQTEETFVGAADLHRTKIDRAGQAVMDADASLCARVNAVNCLGILAYTGGYNGASVAAKFIPAVVHLLHIRELTDDQAIAVVQGLTGMCYCHLRNQRAAHDAGLTDLLQVWITPAYPVSTKAKLWSCYLLSVLSYNISMSQNQAAHGFRESLETLEAEDWVGWPKNYAREMLCLLGFWPPQPVTPCPATASKLDK
ncbi:unnamed protein product [Merluccius merluccius]